MNIIVETCHPGHVHLFRNAIGILRKRGHNIIIAARDKDITLQLLDIYGLEYTNISRQGKGVVGLFFEMLQRDLNLLRISSKFKPDLFLSVASMCSAQVATLLGKVSIIMDDSEHATLGRMAWLPFASFILTSEAYKLHFGKRQIRYKGFHELAYLHPNRFTPDPSVLTELGLKENEKFFIVRFVHWGAAHDVGQKGFSYTGKQSIISKLQEHGKVVISSESPLPQEFEPFRMSISPTRMHDLLNYCLLYIGEGATMASEAAMLGKPSIYVNSLTAGTLEAQERYGLVHHITDEESAIEFAVKLAANPEKTRAEYQEKHQHMLADNIDVTAWLVDFVEANGTKKKPKNI